MRTTFNITLLLLILLATVLSICSQAQLTSGGYPATYTYSIPADTQHIITVKSPNMEIVRRDDAKYPSPYRFGLILKVDISPETSGIWENLPDGGRIWRVTVTSPGALAVSAYFDKFVLPAGAKLFLYNPSKTQVLGAFTSSNNLENGYFATELIAGDSFILEYDQSAGINVAPILHLYNIDYAYRGVGFLNAYAKVQSPVTDCEVNVKCQEGDNWKDEARGVVRIKVRKDSASYWCSGSVINNVRNNRIPYVLTADHCYRYSTAADLQQWIFYFGFDSPTCQTIVPTALKSLTGGTLKAHGGNAGDTGSDFCLILLNQNIPDTFDVYFNGWSRKDTTSATGVCIHHPEGTVKKISTYSQPLATSYYSDNPNPCFWQVSWVATADGHGVTEPGSSGSPLINSNGLIVGTLTGGQSSCSPSDLTLPDYYGKFSWSWDHDGSDSTTRLKDWLDPDSTGIQQLKGLAMGIIPLSGNFSIKVSPNPFTDVLQIQIDGINSQTADLEVLNLMGVSLWSEKIKTSGYSPISISLPGLSCGIYFLRIKVSSYVSTTKLIRL